MSVLSIERPEEFPELAAACQRAFEQSMTAKPAPSIPPRTTPLCITVTDFDYPTAPNFATEKFAAATTQTAQKSTPPASAPQIGYFTMEDGGQSAGATETSARAALLLAHIDDVPAVVAAAPTPAPRRVPNYRPCHGGPAYCC